jgi:hypothetical protein
MIHMTCLINLYLLTTLTLLSLFGLRKRHPHLALLKAPNLKPGEVIAEA